jgi:DNA-binding NtrC family response regulator
MGPCLAAPRVLLIEDEEDILTSLLDGLAPHLPGIALDGVPSAEEARDRLAKGSFDVVVCDEKLPGEQGLEFLAWLRGAHPATRRVLVTAYGQGLATEAKRRAEVHLFVAKPLSLAALARDLQGLLPQGDRKARAR